VRQKKHLNWEDLQYFQALADRKTLSAAAKKRGVTHATMSRRINHLEEVTKKQLFDQRAHGFDLTQAGEQIYRHILKMTAEATQIEDVFFADEEEGVVRVSATPALCEDIILHGLAAFRTRYPKIALEILAETHNVSLAKQEAHLVLRLTRPETGAFVIRQVGRLEFGLFRACQKPALALEAAQMVGYTEAFAWLPESQWLQNAFPDHSFALRSNSLLCQKRAIECGFGFGLLPLYMVRNSEKLEQIQTIESPLPSREIWLVMREAFKDVPRIRHVADYLGAMFQQARFAPGSGP